MSSIKVVLLSLIITITLINLPSTQKSKASTAYDFDNLEVGRAASELNLAGVEFFSPDYRVMNVSMVSN